MTERGTQRAIRGDFQTPSELAARLVETLDVSGATLVVEPTVGTGTLLAAALARNPKARGYGIDLDAEHLAMARERCGGAARLAQDDVFTHPFEEAWRPGDRVLVIGNPPWITSAAMTGLGGQNLPRKSMAAGARNAKGLGARTGDANFDVAEWIVLRLVEVFDAPGTRFVFLLKTQVARRLLLRFEERAWPIRGCAIHRIDAVAAFGAHVDACAFRFEIGDAASLDATLHPRLGAAATQRIGPRNGHVVEDVERHGALAHLLAGRDAGFRSGVKHDAADVFEVASATPPFGLAGGSIPDAASVYPFRKARDLDADTPPAGLVVPYPHLGQPEHVLRDRWPATHAYLADHAPRLAARKSRIYQGRARFAQFGIGPYSFAPYKLAVAALARSPHFVLVGPHEGRPTMLDDTTYFLPFDHAARAEAHARLLRTPTAARVLAMITQTGSKRVLTKRGLDTLDLPAIAVAAHAEGELDADDVARTRR